MKIDGKIIWRNVKENVSRQSKNIQKKNKRLFAKRVFNTFLYVIAIQSCNHGNCNGNRYVL